MIQPAWRLRPKVVSDGKHGRDEMVEEKQEDGMWMNHVSENDAFDLNPLDQSVSYESNRLPPNSYLLFGNKYDS